MSTPRPLIVALGEVLWDVFPDGPRFGGAPANFACHAAALGADVFLVSRVGMDDLGDRAIAALREHGVNTDQIGRDSVYPTGTVQVELDPSGTPRYEIRRGVAWDNLAWSEELGRLADRADAVYFGTLGQRSEPARRLIQRFVAATPARVLRILDVNLRPPFDDDAVIRQSLELANVLKLSDEELGRVAGAGGLSGTEAETLARLRDRYELRLVAQTRGKEGAQLVGRDEVSTCAGVPTTVKDTVGAGDSFTAALTLGLLRGEPLDTVNRHACQVAAFVCSQSGATPALPERLRSTASEPADQGHGSTPCQ